MISPLIFFFFLGSCIYLIDPDSIVPSSLRKSTSRREMHSHRKTQYQSEEPSSFSSDISSEAGREEEKVEGGKNGDEEGKKTKEEEEKEDEDYEKVEKASSGDVAGSVEGKEEPQPIEEGHVEVEGKEPEVGEPEVKEPEVREAEPEAAAPVNEENVEDATEKPEEVVDKPEEPPVDTKDKNQPHLSPAELRIIKRLSARVNILPVVARADSLTDERLEVVKEAIRSDFTDAGLAAGVFGWKVGLDNERPADVEEEEGEEDDTAEQRRVIRIKSSSRRSQSRNRSRWHLDNDDEEALHVAPPSSINGDGNLGLGQTSLESLLPFAVFSPEPTPPSRLASQLAPSTPPQSTSALPGNGTTSPSGRRPSSSASSVMGLQRPSLSAQSKLAELRGRFVRKYRWGVVDALDPNHCDFAALRTAVLGTHIKVGSFPFRAPGSGLRAPACIVLI